MPYQSFGRSLHSYSQCACPHQESKSAYGCTIWTTANAILARWAHILQVPYFLLLCLSKISKSLSGWGLCFFYNSRRCSFLSRRFSRNSAFALPFACCGVREPGSAPPNRRASAIREKMSEIDLRGPPVVDLSVLRLLFYAGAISDDRTHCVHVDYFRQYARKVEIASSEMPTQRDWAIRTVRSSAWLESLNSWTAARMKERSSPTGTRGWERRTSTRRDSPNSSPLRSGASVMPSV
jgi:hypothetical protein